MRDYLDRAAETTPTTRSSTRHEQRGHDRAIEYIGGMLKEQARIVNETPQSNPSWPDYQARLTVLVWAHDGLVQQSTETFGTDPSVYEIQL